MKVERYNRLETRTVLVPDGASLTLDEREFQTLRDWLMGIWPDHTLWWLRQKVVFADGRSEQ